METTETTPLPRLTFRGGSLGALAPFALFLAGVAWLALSGAPDERGFWPVLLAALGLGLLLARDPGAYAEAALAGMSRPLVTVMIVAWLLAGVLASVLAAGGLVDSLVWLAALLGLHGASYVVAAFLVAAVVSTATGTSLGTLLVTLPLLYPAGGALGAEPAILAGAILGGATFGDNVSPVSDTTIASAGTQGAALGAVVRTRLPYALVAAALALGAYLATGSAGPASGTAQLTGEPLPLVLLAAPIAVLALLFARRHLVEGLMAGIAVGLGAGLATGLLEPGQLIAIDRENFIARGLILEGMERAVGVSIFTLLLMGLVGGLEASGLLDRLLARGPGGPARSPREAETAIVATTSAAVLLTTHSVVSILAVGPFARETGEAAGLPATRRANLLDLTVCTFPFLVPYCIPTILASALTGGSEGVPRLSPLTVGLSNFHSWALLVVLVVIVTTGWGRPSGHSSPGDHPGGASSNPSKANAGDTVQPTNV
jgi:Na+/H+ antiporter NhaC